jgi:chromosome transmission fidelity protein 1
VGAVSNSEVHIQIAELRQILSNFINVVPGGMAVFFPSYSFLNAIKAELHVAQWKKFNAKKKVD